MKKQTFPVKAILGLMLVVAVGAISPQVVQTLAYAAEKGQIAAAREELANMKDLDRLSHLYRTVAKVVKESVVSIQVEHGKRDLFPKKKGRDDDRPEMPNMPGLPEDLRKFFERYRGRAPRRRFPAIGQGSGVILDAKGHIITNEHVVKGADKIMVRLNDGRRFKAKRIGSDHKADVAILKIEAKRLRPAQLGNSDAVETGDIVLAVGSPWGLDQTVTHGIISGKGRSIHRAGNRKVIYDDDFLQTDAPINPGNSGGPLVNVRGEVIGINTAIKTGGSAGWDGVGFAVPINAVKRVARALIDGKSLQRGYLGISFMESDRVPLEQLKALNIANKHGLLIMEVRKGTPAERAKLLPNDFVTHMDGKVLRNGQQLRTRVRNAAPGSKMTLGIIRAGKAKTLNVTIGRQPAIFGEEESLTATGPELQSETLGLSVTDLTDELAKAKGYQGLTGALVTRVAPGSVAKLMGLAAGDLITHVQNKPVDTAKAFQDALSGIPEKEGISLTIRNKTGSRAVFLPRE